MKNSFVATFLLLARACLGQSLGPFANELDVNDFPCITIRDGRNNDLGPNPSFADNDIDTIYTDVPDPTMLDNSNPPVLTETLWIKYDWSGCTNEPANPKIEGVMMHV